MPLFGIWAAGPQDAYAVGYEGHVLHFDGSRWGSVPRVTGKTLKGIGGVPNSGIWAVGDSGTIIQRVSGDWERVESGTAVSLYSVVAVTKNRAWAVGDHGMIMRFDGQRWQQVVSSTGQGLRAVWSSDPGHVFAAGEGIVLSWDGKHWSQLAVDLRICAHGIYSPDQGKSFWLSGAKLDCCNEFHRWTCDCHCGAAIGHKSGNRLTLNTDSSPGFTKLWGSPFGVWAVGGGGVIWRNSGAAWQRELSGTTAHLLDVYGVQAERGAAGH